MDFFTVLLVILFVVAIIDLIVGVSNDAVNFLNSAIGSKVAPIRTILLVASAGVVLGSMFSSGMMEIARNGLFNPSFFTFEQVMFLFLAVMLTDVILLDFYNSLGLPTSTTVSLVFEILGAAFAIGVLHSFSTGLSWGEIQLDNILNFSSAFTIITGIFLSIFLAFIVGSLIQRVSRVIFTFSIKKSIKNYGAVFCGLSITTIIYFLLIKGVKGSSLVTDTQVKWVMENTWSIVLASLVFFSVVIQLIMWYTKINPLKVVVLLGTFSLAMAFAGNDLVNFIGVAVGGLVAFQNWAASGVPADQYQMGILSEKLITPTWILLVAGVVMVVTLWTNAKSRKVTETELSLSRQDEGDEKFSPNMMSRILVGVALLAGRTTDSLLPRSWSKAIERRFEKRAAEAISEKDQPSFDLVRASVNLLVSSVLIAYGTSQKLPLSTTFVTFMVAMGTSFADQAWGRESAVYRVAGVMNVIAGWLITAIVAFTFSGFIAFILFKTGHVGVIVVTVLAAFLIIRSHVRFAKKEKKESSEKQIFASNLKDLKQAIDESNEVTVKNLKVIMKVYGTSVESLAKEKRKAVEKSMWRIKELREQNEKIQHKIIKYVKKMPRQNLAASRLYILMFDYMQDLYQSILLISESCTVHLQNYHTSPSKRYLQQLQEVEKGLQAFTELVCKDIGTSHFEHAQEIKDQQQKWLRQLDQFVDDQISAIQKDNVGNRIGLLQMRLLLESKDVLNAIFGMYTLYLDYHNQGIGESKKM
ncbi:MAG: inorganic phosphate transporter [Cyclobacteriaceae bacterium]|nr:inorganic phosphate transporter [Cyclobacteriaceae bacterium]